MESGWFFCRVLEYVGIWNIHVRNGKSRSGRTLCFVRESLIYLFFGISQSDVWLGTSYLHRSGIALDSVFCIYYQYDRIATDGFHYLRLEKRTETRKENSFFLGL